jgi:hypothetical protein
MSPAERADVIVDFTDVPAGSEIYLINEGPDEPFAGGLPFEDFDPADSTTTGQIMKFTVVTEIWEIYNFTMDAHPIHLHEIMFQVLDRQPLMLDSDMMTMMPAMPAGPAVPAEPWEAGFKDTVIAYPGQVTRIKAKFDLPGQYVWHCHIVEHEDNEMMRPYRVGP